MKKLFYIILFVIFLILDVVIIFTCSNSAMWIICAFIIAEIAIYSTCIIFEIITLQKKSKDKNSDEENDD